MISNFSQPRISFGQLAGGVRSCFREHAGQRSPRGVAERGLEFIQEMSPALAASVHEGARLLLQEKAPEVPRLRLPWDDPRLVFVVREPFLSKESRVSLAAARSTLRSTA